jgi:hypothetical protein
VIPCQQRLTTMQILAEVRAWRAEASNAGVGAERTLPF